MIIKNFILRLSNSIGTESKVKLNYDNKKLEAEQDLYFKKTFVKVNSENVNGSSKELIESNMRMSVKASMEAEKAQQRLSDINKAYEDIINYKK
jgi:hypothetical protein